MRKTPALVAIVLGLSLTLSACGSDDVFSTGTSSDTSATEHNDADVAFATDMIEHHAQALAMVELTVGRNLDPEVQALADDIRAAQAPEIKVMTDWLTEWGEDVPESTQDHADDGHDMEDMEGGEMDMDSEMPGMMSAEDMRALEDASAADFHDMWVEMMIEHHEGAVEMAEAEQSHGQYRPAVDLAGDIVESQTAEIEKMHGLLS